MTIMIVLGIILLFYGIWAKSSELANKQAVAVELSLNADCNYQLQTVSERSLFFVSSKTNCPLAEVSKTTGKLVATYVTKP